MKLIPNYLVGFSKIILFMILIFGIAAYGSYLSTGTWDILDYWPSLLIPFVFLPVFVFLIFVPQYIVVDIQGFTIKYPLKIAYYIAFHNVHAFCSTRGVFLIQTNDGSTLQIYAGCFTRKIWKSFVNLIKDKCPGKKTWFWIGPWALR